MVDLKKTGAYISVLRKQSDMTQIELAHQLYVSHQAVSKWERGESLPDINTLVNLGKLFNITVDHILRGGEVADSSELGEGEIIAQLSEQKPEQVSDMINKGDIDVQAFINVAPVVKPSVTDDIAQNLNGLTMDHLTSLAPFLGSETLYRLVDHVSTDMSFQANHLSSLAPFLDRQHLDALIDKLDDEAISDHVIMGIAPFVSKEALGRLVDRVTDGKLSSHVIVGLAPFLGHENLQKVVKNIAAGQLDGNLLASIAPFIGQNALADIVNNMLKSIGKH